MAYEVPALGTAGQVYTAAAHNIIVNDVLVSRALQVNLKATVLTAASSISVATQVLSSDISGLTVEITPASSTSKVLVTLLLSADMDTTGTIHPVLYRDGAVVSAATGDAAGSRARVWGSISATGATGAAGSFSFLDSPATTSPVTYSVRVRHGSGGTRTIYFNRSPLATDNLTYFRQISTILAQEIPV